MNSFLKKNIFCECTKITVYAGTNVPGYVCVKARGQPQVSVLKFTCLRQALFGGGDSSDGGSISSDGVWLAQELPLLAPPPSPASSSHLQVDPVSKWFLGIPTHILILIKKVLVPTGPSSQSLMAA